MATSEAKTTTFEESKTQPLIEFLLAESRFDESTDDFQRRLLRAATHGLTDLLLRKQRPGKQRNC